MKRILNYPGGKWTLANKIIPLFPEHTTYLEPFFGSGAVFFNKPISKVETINDLDSRVINFFTVCRDSPQELAERIYLTPMSREEHRNTRVEVQDPIENARLFLLESWQSIGGIQKYKTGWRSNIDKLGGKLHEWNEIGERVLEVAGRLKQAQIENQDAMKLLQRYDREKVFVYVDPPYLLSTRNSKYYQTELEDDRHVEMLNILKNYKGKVMLSGYENELYNGFLPDWNKEVFTANAESGQKRIETVWMNY